MVKRALTRQRRKDKARRIMQEVQKGKKHQFVCRVLHCEGNDTATRGKQGRTNWKAVRGRSVKIDEKEGEERTC